MTGRFAPPVSLRPGTDCWRLFEVLADGRPHDHTELYALGMIVHSRIADLRQQHGCTIDQHRESRGGAAGGRAKRVYVYQLAGVAQPVERRAASPEVAGSTPASRSFVRRSIDEVVALLERERFVPVGLDDDLSHLPDDEQLSLAGAFA